MTDRHCILTRRREDVGDVNGLASLEGIVALRRDYKRRWKQSAVCVSFNFSNRLRFANFEDRSVFNWRGKTQICIFVR